MIKTILVDDEPSGINTLKRLLTEYCPELKIVADCSNADEARQKIELLEPELAFLDISMPGKSSLDMLSELDRIRFEIIFVTAHNEYALQAFRYSAVDYLVKPIDEDLLAHAVRRASRRISEHALNTNVSALLHNLQPAQLPQDRKLCIPSLKGFQVVELKDILFCEASKSYTNFHFSDKRVICTARSIHDYEELLEDSGFMRIHKSYLVNLFHVKEYHRGEGGSVVLTNGHEIEVSRRKKDDFMSRMRTVHKY